MRLLGIILGSLVVIGLEQLLSDVTGVPAEAELKSKVG